MIDNNNLPGISSFVEKLKDSTPPEVNFGDSPAEIAIRFFSAFIPQMSGGTSPPAVSESVFLAMYELLPKDVRDAFPANSFMFSNYTQVIGGSAKRVPDFSDVWYLHVGITVVPPWSYTTQGDWYINEKQSDGIIELISPLIKACGDVSLLKCPRNDSDISESANNGIDTIKEARYESKQGSTSYLWPSRGPDEATAGGKDFAEADKDYCAYIAFPVGPLDGCIRAVSLVVEKITKSMKLDDAWNDKDFVVNKNPASDSGGSDVFGGLFPPLTVNNKMYGLPLISDYGTRCVPNLEYAAKDFIGIARHLSHHWFRYYFKKTCKFLIPGKFIGITIIPEATACWWYQRSVPLLYSGNFFETAHYTSGKIVGILPEKDKKHKEVGTIYIVSVRGVSLYLQSTDFASYNVGDDVAIIKRVGLLDRASSWLDVDDLNLILEALGDDPSSGVYTLFKDYVIAPITFYEEDDSEEDGSEDDSTGESND